MVARTKYSLLPAQYEFLFGYDHDKVKDGLGNLLDVAVYQGGFGSGKTFCGSLRGLLFALKWPGCRGLVGAQTQDLLDGTTKQKYIEHLAQCGFREDIHFWWQDRGNTLVLKNGSTIRFKTLSDWSQFRSTEFSWIEIEEASLIDEKTFHELIARVREQMRPEWKDYFRSIFLHTNPGGSRGWIYKLFHNKKTKRPNWRAVIASTSENVYLPKDYELNLRSLYASDEAIELIDGRDNDNDNTIAFPFFNADNIIDDLRYEPSYPLILTCDFNYNPMCWYLVQNIGDKWHVLRELIDNNVTTKQMCERVTPIIASYKTRNLIIMGDSHGRDKKTNGSDYSVMLSHFGSVGFNCILRVQKSNPLIVERLAVLRRYICNARGERNLFVDSNCHRLLYNFDEARNNLATGGLRLPTDKEIQQDDTKRYLIHPIDAVSYPIYFEQKYKDITSS